MGCAQSSDSTTPHDTSDAKLVAVQPAHKSSSDDHHQASKEPSYIIVTDQHGSEKPIIEPADPLQSVSNTRNAPSRNKSLSASKTATFGLASQRRSMQHKPIGLPSSRATAQQRSSVLESPRSTNGIVASIRSAFRVSHDASADGGGNTGKAVTAAARQIIKEPKTVAEYETMCIQCYNCEQYNVSYACESCKPDDTTALPFLCKACNIGMHQFGKTALHTRRVLTCHTADNVALNVASTNTAAAEFNALLCFNCDEPYPSIYCLHCNQFVCSTCQLDIHAPQKMRGHTRLPMSAHLRYVHISTAQHVQSSNKLLKSVRFNKQPMMVHSPVGKVTVANGSVNTPGKSSGDSKPSAKKKQLNGKPSMSMKASVVKANILNGASQRRQPKYSAKKAKELKGDIQPVRNVSVEGNVFVFSEPTCKDALHEQQHEYRNIFNPHDKQGLVDIVSIQSGPTHSCAVTAMGSLFMWGNNMEHQIGAAADGQKYVDEPQCIEFERHNPVKQVACGYNHNIALCHNNCVYTWGSGLMGVLGTGSDEDKMQPTRLPLQHCTAYDEDVDDSKAADGSGDETVVYVAAGQYNTGVVVKGRTDGHQVYMFGEGAAGQLGNNKQKPSLFPTLITVDKTQQVVGLSIGSKHCAAWTASGDVYTWGSNEFGQLGYLLGKTSDDDLSAAANCQLTPRRVDQLKVMSLSAARVYCSERHTTVLTKAGTVYSFGSGETHQLGIFDNVDSVVPVKATGLPSKVVHMCVGSSITMCVTENGQLYGFGYSLETPVPTLIDGLKGRFLQQVCIGQNDNACVLTGCADDVYEWQYDGATLDGEIADANSNVQQPQVNKALRGKRIQSFSAGKTHYAAVTSDGRLYSWGDNTDYQLGLPSTAAITFMPLPVEVKVKHSVVDVQCGSEHTVALTADGIVLTWGQGQDGKLGHGKSSDVYEPKIVEYFVSSKIKIKAIAIGASNTACITEAGALYVWGSNSKGQCGSGDYNPQFKPQTVAGLSNEKVQKVCVGYQHMLVLTVSSKVYACGDNTFGQLGLGTSDDNESHNKLQEVNLLSMKSSPASDIACGDNVSAVMNGAGQLYMCGTGETKQQCHCVDAKEQTYANELEDIRTMTRVQLPFMTATESIKLLSIQGIDVCCITTSDNVYVWGWNFSQENVCTKLDWYPDTQYGIVTQPTQTKKRFQRVVLGQGRLLLQS